MGVYIQACAIKQKLSDKTDSETYHELVDKHDSVLLVENYGNQQDFIKPFEEGIYLSEPCKTYVNMSYGGNGDFIDALGYIAEECESWDGFYTTLKASGIDNCVSYVFAKDMLEEFTTFKDKAENVFISHFGEGYGGFLYGCYKGYMKVLEECVEVKGMVEYR